MNAGPPQPDDIGPRRPRADRAAWAAAAGIILGISAVICLALGAISGQQAIAMALPAALLIAGGLIVMAMPDPATGQRGGFLAGLRAGLLLRRWRLAAAPAAMRTSPATEWGLSLQRRQSRQTRMVL